ncbi:hypothetical protein AA309_20265 [Microvirga vignae]|uniref:B30.2/SPRY domain-containing protein n=1 Tax=Microvirga vignae TaxID=1225564 RepID=A0A0H1R9B0_9HYPH|nr:hypothetical protein [Microvirga vignae]KLK91431.1 hypothetical protein AA309_20265 [Microvirga vignae]
MAIIFGVSAAVTRLRPPVNVTPPTYDDAFDTAEVNLELRAGSLGTWGGGLFATLKTVWYVDGVALADGDPLLVADTNHPDRNKPGYTIKKVVVQSAWAGKSVQLRVQVAGALGSAEAQAPLLDVPAAPADEPVVIWDYRNRTGDRTNTSYIKTRNSGRSMYGGRRFFTTNGAVSRQGIGNKGRSAGKWYCEFLSHDAPGSHFRFGLSAIDAGFANAGMLGDHQWQLGLKSDGWLYTYDDRGQVTSSSKVGPNWRYSETIGMAADFDTDPNGVLVWFTADGVTWNNNGSADPTTAVGGHLLQNQKASGTPKAMHPALFSASASDTPNFALSLFCNVGEQLRAAPTGFNGWDNLANNGAMPTLTNAEARRLWQLWHMGPAPSAARMTLVDDLISGLKADGVWTKLKSLYLLAAADFGHGVYDWKKLQRAEWGSSSTPPVPDEGYATWLADRYYKNGGGGGYLTASSAASTELAQNDAHLGLISRTEQADGTNTRHELGAGNAYLANNLAGGTIARANAGAADTYADVSFIGHNVWTRGGSSQAELYRDGALAKTITRTSAGPSGSITIGAVNAAAITPNGINELVAAHYGQALTAAEALAIYNRLNTYRTALGA